MFIFAGVFFWVSSAMAGPLVAHGVNSSRVVPGNKVSSVEVAQMVSKVKTIAVGQVSGPHGEAFKRAALKSLNNSRQGSYQTGAEMGASMVGGLGKLASVGTKMAVSNAGFVGAGMVGKAGAKAIDGASEAAAERLDGIDRHPEEGFGVVDEAAQAAAEKAAAKRASSGSSVDGKLQTAANVAGMLGAGQVKSALELGKDLKSVGNAFFREGVAGNSPKFSGVHLPIKGIESGRADASITATVRREQKPDKHFQETRTKKKRDKNGKVVKDKNGKPIIIKYKVDCIKRVVEVQVTSKLSRGGTKVMGSKKSGTGTDKQCGKERMKKIKSVDALARPIVRAAGSKWGAHIQPQMETIRLKFFPTGTTALSISHLMKNGHAPGMCLLDDALARDPADHAAQYNKATILEAYGLNSDAHSLYSEANADPELQKARWSKGMARTQSRLTQIARMKTAYGMTAKGTHYPYAESCPAIDIEGTLPITKRANLHVTEKGEVIRKLHVGERLRIIQDGKKWAHVQQLDGSEGWVNRKKAYKSK